MVPDGAVKLKKQETVSRERGSKDQSTREDQRKKGPRWRPRARTHAAGLVARPLVVELAGDAPLPHQLEGRLAGEGQSVAVLEAVAATMAERRHARVAAAPPLDFCNAEDAELRVS